MVSVHELFHLQPDVTLLLSVCDYLSASEVTFCSGGEDLGGVMSVICHASVSSFVGHTGNSCKKWFCLVSVPWGEGDCLWVSLSVLCCLKCHFPAAARWDPGTKKCAEVLELTSLRSTSVLGEKQPLPYQVHMLLIEFRQALRVCDVWYLISMPKCFCGYVPSPFWVSRG